MGNDRPDPRDAYTPCETEIGLAMAAAYELGMALDTHSSALRSGDIFSDLDPYVLAACRTDADAEHLAAAVEASLITLPAEPAEVVDLAARRRSAPAIPGGVRAA